MKRVSKADIEKSQHRATIMVAVVLAFLLIAVITFALFPSGGIITSSTIEAALERVRNAGYVVFAAGEYDDIVDQLDDIEAIAKDIDHHLHNTERWLGANVGWDGTNEVTSANNSSVDPFQLDGGNDTWGTPLCLVGSSDTPIKVGQISWDIHRLNISDTEHDTKYRVCFAWGTSYNVAVAVDNCTEVDFSPYERKADAGPVEVMMPTINSGIKLFAAVWARNQNTSTIDFTVGIHEHN